MAKKKAQKPAKPAPKQTTKADRAKILADMKANNLTAKAAAKKYGISFWTIYGWKKNRSKAKSARPAARPAAKRVAAKPSPARSTGSFGETLRPLVAQIVREEIVRLVG
ncbi:MAG: helix-turn-helix domain-containing protein [bacterium]